MTGPPVRRSVAALTMGPAGPKPEDNVPKFYKWTVEIEVAAEWVADGFDLEDGVAVADLLLNGRLSHCRSDEVRGRIVKAPPRDEVLAEQGYGPAMARVKAARKAKRGAA